MPTTDRRCASCAPPTKGRPHDRQRPRVQAIAAAARELVELRDRWLDPEGASEAELKKRTLTNLYNERPTWPSRTPRSTTPTARPTAGPPISPTSKSSNGCRR